MGSRRYPPGPKVLYIGGTGRTGSTLLTRVLGEVPGWFAGGELAFLWSYGLRDRGRCSCDAPLATCPVWSPVLDALRRHGTTIDPDRMVELRRRCWSVHLPLMINRRLARRCLARLEEFPDVVAALYRELADQTGSAVIVDSSKEPHYSWILRDRTDLDVYFVQLVRDPRAVAHSWRRRRGERGFGGDVEMDRRGPLRSAVYYDVSNVAAEAIWSRTDRFRFMRYEDFVARPAQAVRELAAFVGEPIADSPIVDGTFVAGAQHMAWGNPNRFATGPTSIRPDDAWRTGGGRMRRVVSSLATAPVARRYGYPARPSGDLGPAHPRLWAARVPGEPEIGPTTEAHR